jgi:hypothetical protein
MSELVESRMGAVAWGPWPSPRFPSPLISRVEGWRAGVARGPDPHHVSRPLHVARNVRISRIARPHLLHAKAYGTYPAGATFGPSRRTR